MQKNLVLFFVLTFGILFSWEVFVQRPQRDARRRLQPPLVQRGPVTTEERETFPTFGDGTPSSSEMQRLVEYTVGRQRVAFNLYGAGIHQWWIEEQGGTWLPLVLENDNGLRPLSTFVDVEFEVRRRREGDFIFEGTTPEGLRVEKIFSLSPDSHMHNVSMKIVNTGPQGVVVRYGLGWGPGIESGDPDKKFGIKSQRALGFESSRLRKLKPAEIMQEAFQWWGVDARYFLAAFVNESDKAVPLRVRKMDKKYLVEQVFEKKLAPGEHWENSLPFYLGPKSFANLKEMGYGMEAAVNFGWFGTVGRVVLFCLYFFQRLTDNYGWAIILLTLSIGVLTIPLTMKSFRSSQRMKALQPQMKKIQERYKGEPKRLQAEMMHLYKRHGIKFMGLDGCFPMLIQLPVFLALFNTLRSTYELRHAPWIGWIRDLSIHDPLYVLPVLMAVGTLVHQKMTMSTADPAQARIMYFMPLIFLFISLKFPAGLVLYWFTNSLFNIGVYTVLLKTSSPSPKP